MSIVQEKLTEVRVVSIVSKVKCDGCSATMAEEVVKVNFYDPDMDYSPSFNLMPGWVEIVKGQFDRRVKAHACGKCLGTRVEELLK